MQGILERQDRDIIEDKKTNKKRIEWIDWIRAIGIFLVVLGHGIGNDNDAPELRLWIYSFHIPLFFIISGMVFNADRYSSLKDCVKAKARNLVVPYFFINIFTIPFWYLYYNIFNIKVFNIIDIIKAMLIGHTEIASPINGPTWFLLTLFLSEVLFYIIYKIVNGNNLYLANASVLLILVGYVESITSRKLYMFWHIATVPIACGLMIIGYLALKYIIENEEKLKKIKITVPIIFLIIGVYISIYVNDNVSMHTNKYNSIILTFSSIFFTITGIVLIMMKLKKARILSFIGKTTMIMLAIHKPVQLVEQELIPNLKGFFMISVTSIVTFIALLPIVYLIEKFMPFLVGDLKRYSKNGKKVIYALLIIILLSFTGVHIVERLNLYKYKISILKEDYIAHALGGINDDKNTNSRDALENSYSKGIKLFEVDISLTSDEELVCINGWSKDVYNETLEIEYNKENAVMSYEQFMNTKIKGKYTTMSFKDLIEFMKVHDDIYVMIDIGNQKKKKTKNIYEKIVQESNNDSKILNRLVINGSTTDMIKAVKEVYDFKIINLYWPSKADRKDKKIDTKEEFIEYCKKNEISSLSTSLKTYKKEKDTIEYFKKKGLIVYVFTENDENEAKDILKDVDVVGTDFI